MEMKKKTNESNVIRLQIYVRLSQNWISFESCTKWSVSQWIAAYTVNNTHTSLWMKLQFLSFDVRLQDEYTQADAFVLVYSCVDKASFTRIEQLLMTLQDLDLLRTRPVIIAANKIDLARSRAVSSQGKFDSNNSATKAITTDWPFQLAKCFWLDLIIIHKPIWTHLTFISIRFNKIPLSIPLIWPNI